MKNNSHFSNLIKKIETKQAVVGVVGLGYVGLPLAAGFADVGFSVVGIELDPRKVSKLNQGISYIPDVPTEQIAPLVENGTFKATINPEVLRNIDIVIICVPTPLDEAGDPDMTSIKGATDMIAKYLHTSQLVCLESTTYPGTVTDLILPKLQTRGMEVGKDFFLAFSPERIDPNNANFRVENTPKVVGGVTQYCTKAAEAIYKEMVVKVVTVSSPATAEMVKIFENTFRAINIGLANEMAIMCQILGLDIWEIIDAADTKPFGFMPFYPGPGIGGHCIPVDPSYLSWKMRSMNYRTRFIELATDINSSMPKYVYRLAVNTLNKADKVIHKSKVLLLGMAYKRDIDDLRESPALDVFELLHEAGADVSYHDSFVPEFNYGKKVIHSVELTKDVLTEADLVIILTDHSTVDYEVVCQHARSLLDTRNATKKIKNPSAHIVKL
ncbi:nucleotide sugar dehydrogenase [bacterium]|nr:nucleotide sugar dehydrogenase [bacterium]